MAITYDWYTGELPKEENNPKLKTIVKVEPVPATIKEVTFTLDKKEKELVVAKTEVINAQAKVDELEAEIAAVKTALEIVDEVI